MSEYLSKKAALEWLKKEQRDEGWLDQTKHGFFWVKREIESGAFDADTSEIQRLRAALVEIKQLLNENRENDGAFQSWNHMQAWKVAAQTLSTTIEPTNAAKVERFECPCCGCEINTKEGVGTEWPKAEGDGNE